MARTRKLGTRQVRPRKLKQQIKELVDHPDPRLSKPSLLEREAMEKIHTTWTVVQRSISKKHLWRSSLPLLRTTMLVMAATVAATTAAMLVVMLVVTVAVTEVEIERKASQGEERESLNLAFFDKYLRI